MSAARRSKEFASRVKGLSSRYRQDGQLPPPVTELLVDSSSARARALVGRSRPGDVEHFDWGGATNGPLTASLHEIGISQVTAVARVFEEAAVNNFVVRERMDGFELGVYLADQQSAWDALKQLPKDCIWQVATIRGSRHRSATPGTHGKAEKHAQRATSWLVGGLWSAGIRRIGESAAVLVTFWDLGTSGKMEQLGIRGNERFELDSPQTTESIGKVELPGRRAFPIAKSSRRFREPIDLVFTWVDGDDPVWLESMREWSKTCGVAVDPTARHSARYTSRDELRYSLRAAWMHAGWVRKIYIVTAGQRPPWLGEHEMIEIVDHETIMPSSALPTFNSHAIEASLHHIDGLTEYFLYLNDDVFLSCSVRPETFVTPNGLLKVFLSRARIDSGFTASTAAVDTAARLGQTILESSFDTIVTRKPAHGPFVLRRSLLLQMEHRHQEAFDTTVGSRFRDPGDLSVASGFAQHYALLTQQAIEAHLAVDYVPIEDRRLPLHLDRLLLADKFEAFCLNETGASSGMPPTNEKKLAHFLEHRFPVAAPWELN